MSDMRDRVQKLLDKAYSTEFAPEREALLQKADEMMLRYQIEQWELLDPDRPNAAFVKAAEPELRTIEYFDDHSGIDEEALKAVASIFWSLAQHFHCRIGYYGLHLSKVVGYPADLDFLELMFTTVKLHMINTMYPKVLHDQDIVISIVNFKTAGYKWEDMHVAFRDHPMYQGQKDKPFDNMVGRWMYDRYKKYLKAHGEKATQVREHPAVWRRGFMDGYTAQLYATLQDMKRRQTADNPLLPDLLASVKSVLDEAFWNAFPDKRPHPKGCDCDSCHYQRCHDRGCTRRICVNNRMPMRRSKVRTRTNSTAAMLSGAAAARTVDLSAPGQKVGGSKGALE